MMPLPGGTPDDERLKKLAGAELVISTAMTLPAPADLADYRDTVLVARRAAFVAKRDELDELVTGARATLAQLLDDTRHVMPLAAFDVNELAITDDDAAVTRFREQLVAIVASLKADVVKRIAQVDAKLAALGAATAGDAQVRLLQEAGKILFGDDFQFVPLISLPAATLSDLANAWQHSQSGALTQHLTATRKREFPTDDWLHGVARVRDKMHHWENVMLLGEAAGAARSPRPHAAAAAVRAGRAMAGAGDARRATKSPATGCSTRRTSPSRLTRRRRCAGCWWMSGPKSFRGGRRPPAWPSTSTGRTPSRRRAGCWRCRRSRDGAWSWQRAAGRGQRDAGFGQAPRHRAGAHRHDRLQLVPAGDHVGVHLARDLDLQQPAPESAHLW